MKDKIMNVVKNNKRYILLFICLAIFIFILINVLNENIKSFDTSIYNIISSLKSDFIDIFFRIITRFGDEEILVLSAIACLVFIKNRKIGASIAINLASIGVINHVLKEIIQRPRPPLELRMVQESSFSFPSGHAMAGMAFYGLIIYYIFTNVKNKKVRDISCTMIGLLILLVGISRIYLGVHYASDVLAGFLISVVYLVVYITIILKFIEIDKNNKEIEVKGERKN